jgi:hypothetical protein
MIPFILKSMTINIGEQDMETIERLFFVCVKDQGHRQIDTRPSGFACA